MNKLKKVRKLAFDVAQNAARVPEFLNHLYEEREELKEDLHKRLDPIKNKIRFELVCLKSYWWNAYFSDEYRNFARTYESMTPEDIKRLQKMAGIGEPVKSMFWSNHGTLYADGRFEHHIPSDNDPTSDGWIK